MKTLASIIIALLLFAQGFSQEGALPNMGSLSPYVKMYPNPANDTLNVVFTDRPEDVSLIVIYNMDGEIVIEQKVTRDAEAIIITSLPKGIYSVITVDVENNFIGTFQKNN
jgi:hypothetical protein